MKNEKVILVDQSDNKIGLMDKMEAHEKGVLHRAFSVFIFNKNNELMLQKRAHSKYHSPGLWTNTCCSHQRDGESNIEAGKRRLLEEMGFTTELAETTSFIYKAAFDNDLIEHELDHILIGSFENPPNINKIEVDSWRWMQLEDIKEDIEINPNNYTVWFKIIFQKYYEYINR
jgi:isopentenyl-diphosphate delta-isomerase